MGDSAAWADKTPGPDPLPASIQKRVDALIADVQANLKRQTGDQAIAWIHPLSERERAALGEAVPDDCPVRVQDLVAVDVRFRRADGSDGFGRLIVARYYSAEALKRGKPYSGYWRALRRARDRRNIARELAQLFIANYRAKQPYPIQHVIPLHYFRALSEQRSIEIDDLSMQHNNTYAFAVRRVIGTKRWSRHAIGALDINPFYNPFVLRTDKGQKARVDMSSLTEAAVEAGLITVSPKGADAFAFQRHALTDPHVIHGASSFLVKHLKKRGWSWGGNFRSMKDYHHFAPR